MTTQRPETNNGTLNTENGELTDAELDKVAGGTVADVAKQVMARFEGLMAAQPIVDAMKGVTNK
jgi:hypothetical protein